MSRYAANTEVSVDRSKAELERLLQRYGASAFMYAWDADRAVIQFKADDRLIRFVLPLPKRDDPAFRFTPAKRLERSQADQERSWEQACRVQWRALCLVIKAKLEAVEAGITDLESEFGMCIVLPDGSTVRDHVLPAVAAAYASNSMPAAILGLPAP